MSERPHVSVIVPARNAERYLAEAIDSVRAQTLAPDELLVIVDPASSDRTVALARSLGVTVIEQQGTGIGGAWNQGIAHARGELLAFLSADDRWAEDKLATQVELMVARPELLLTVARFRYFRQPGCELPFGFNPALLERDLDGRIMETLVARRRAFEEIGMFDAEMRVAEDVDWYARASDMGAPMALVERVLLHKRIHDQNLSTSAAGTPLLMRLLKRSIERKRARAVDPGGQGDG